jgi:hypothetical protein
MSDQTLLIIKQAFFSAAVTLLAMSVCALVVSIIEYYKIVHIVFFILTFIAVSCAVYVIFLSQGFFK